MDGVLLKPQPPYLSLATEDDEEEVLTLLREFHGISPYYKYEFNEVGVKQAFRKAVQSEKDQSVVILARDHQNVCTGLIATLKSTVPFLTGAVGLEWAWYVRPTNRTTKTGLLLLEGFEYWCQNIAKVQHIQVSSLATLRPELLERLYVRLGYRKTEEAFFKTL